MTEREHSPKRARLGPLVALLSALVPASAFAQEPTTPEPEPEPTPAPEPTPPPPEPPQPIEVTVEGDRAPAGSVSMRRRDIREMPGVLGDPYRAIEVQPGVTPTTSGLPYFYIRGAPPGNIGYFYDGIRVPLLFHAGAGPGVIPAPLVSRVDMHPGPYPANIGRIAGAAVEAEASPYANEWKGEGAFRFIDIGGVIEGPVGDKGTVLVGGHVSPGAYLLSALVQSVDLGYADYQARASYRVSDRGRLSALAFGAYDYLATISDENGQKDTDVLLDADFHRLDLRYDHDFDSGGKLRAATTLGLDRSRQVGVESATDYRIAARVQASQPIGHGKALLRGGFDVSVDRYDVVQRAPCALGEVNPSNQNCEGGPLGQLDEAFRALFPSRWDVAVGAWADALVVLSDKATVTPGLRIDHYQSMGNTALAIDPKITGRFDVGQRLRLVPSFGVASQLPGFAPLPALQIAGITGGLQRSLQSSLGAIVKLAPIPIEVSASLFRQVTFNLTDPIGTQRGTSLGPERFLSRSTGDAYGLELSARGALRENIFFMASYTLSRSTRTSKAGTTVPSAVDRTHVAHVALLYDIGHGWRAGVRHVFYSGFPAEEAGAGAAPNPHPDRVKPFYRLDARLSKRWKVGKTAWVAFVFDFQNALLAKEVFDVTCDRGICQPRTLGPITIPQLSLEAGF